MVDTATENVIKTYIYLYQRFKWKGENYVFTLEEIGKHLGYDITNRPRYYEMFRNIMSCLENNGLVQYENFYDGKTPRKRLKNVSLKVLKTEEPNG